MDDDRIVEADDIEFGYGVWKVYENLEQLSWLVHRPECFSSHISPLQMYRHRIVGFEERSFIKNFEGKYIYSHYERRRFFRIKSRHRNPTSRLPVGYTIEIVNGTRLLHVRNKTFILGKYSGRDGSDMKDSNKMKRSSSSSGHSYYNDSKSEGYNIMLNSCFLHRAYLEMYFDPVVVPVALLEYVNQQMNCEDILMSVMVTKFVSEMYRPQCGVLAVKSGWINNLEDEACEF